MATGYLASLIVYFNVLHKESEQRANLEQSKVLTFSAVSG